jgi:hypothetical protein
MICTLSTTLHRSTQKHLRWHSITKILRNGPRTHFPFNIGVEDYLVGKFFFDRRYVAGSGEGQLVVVPPSVATSSPSAVVRAKGAAQDPWVAFCASGKILKAAAAKDVAGTMSQRLKEVSQRLTQQLKQVSFAGLRYLLFR